VSAPGSTLPAPDRIQLLEHALHEMEVQRDEARRALGVAEDNVARLGLLLLEAATERDEARDEIATLRAAFAAPPEGA
jgi:hypothetical protein